MLEALRGLTEQDWALIGTILFSLITGAFTARKGLKRNSVEVGCPPPPPDRMEYLIQDVRSCVKRIESLEERLDDHHEYVSGVLHQIHIDVVRKHG